MEHATATRPSVERGTPIPLYEQISQWLRAEVEEGNLGPGGRTPSELEIARTFGVSRTTVRKALERLVNEGMLYRRAGMGTFVTSHRISFGASSSESFSATMDALGLAHETLVLLADIVPAPSVPAGHLRLRAGSPVVCVRRLRRVEGEAAALHTTYLPPAYEAILRADLTRSLHVAMHGVGARVVETDDQVEAVAADIEEAELLEVAPGAPLLAMTGTGFGAARTPLRYTEARYRGELVRFRLGALSSREMRVSVKSGAA